MRRHQHITLIHELILQMPDLGCPSTFIPDTHMNIRKAESSHVIMIRNRVYSVASFIFFKFPIQNGVVDVNQFIFFVFFRVAGGGVFGFVGGRREVYNVRAFGWMSGGGG
ncbi:hypothetical protein L1987_55655 [Smallanthus sonchifolius]|uniref:Uncharacterized protein n=1 Tax=Smallanthus sonchifolius TaxID=185202 RepID=A0ACB9EBL5_9ASTR|nr:hypothetical protein L1987_55655 [Smallanthus sonchifolius]